MSCFTLPDYPHLEFRRCWDLTDSSAINLGKCTAIIECLTNLPIAPDVQRKMRLVSFQRGAQATTAIEGNTLSDEELQKVLDGKKLPESRKYQLQEVENALKTMEFLRDSVVKESFNSPVSPKFLCDLNKRIGQSLGNLYDGVPGKFRQDRRHVARYLAPPPEHVPKLIDSYCEWLRSEFRFHDGKQSMEQAIVQAIVAHVFFEWIHPFADGNGRTGRMIEFYILLRAGLPDITAHVLANHYNDTRIEYAANFEEARKRRRLTGFLAYALQGFADGLQEALHKTQEHLVDVVWSKLVYDRFANEPYHKKSVFKRRRSLALALPLNKSFTAVELLRTSDALLEQYIGNDSRKLTGDLVELERLNLVVKQQDRWVANSAQILSPHSVLCVKRT